ncbi:hypothetical protein SDJN02_21622, partial [Cucurbita argyrosperma subsp. argyrosperma]
MAAYGEDMLVKWPVNTSRNTFWFRRCHRLHRVEEKLKLRTQIRSFLITFTRFGNKLQKFGTLVLR